MKFVETSVVLDTRICAVDVRLTADALHTLWGESVGPQTAEGLIDANREIIEEIAADKLLLGRLEDGVVVIDGIDIES